MKKKLTVIVLIEAVILVIVAVIMWNRPKFEMSIPIEEAVPDHGEIREGALFFDDKAASEVNSTDEIIPWKLKLSIPRGYYNVTVSYRADAASCCRLYSPSDPSAVKCDEITFDHIYNSKSVKMSVDRDVNDLDVYMKYCGFQTFMIDGIYIESSNRNIPAVLCVFIFVFILIDITLCLYFMGINPVNNVNYRTALILLVMTAVVSIPLYSDHLTLFDDFAFTYIKIEGIKDGLLDRQFPVRLHPYTQLGYGYALPYFYPELFVYLPGILRLAGFSVMDSYKIFLFVINYATGLICYIALKRMFDDHRTALFGSFLYVFSIYRIIDMYRRGSAGEFLAVMFLPLVISGLYEIIHKDTEAPAYRNSYVCLMLGMTGIIYSHVLSIEMAGICIVLLCLLQIRRFRDARRLLSLCKAAGCTILLSAGFLFPFADMLRRDVYKVFRQTPYSISQNALNIRKYLGFLVDRCADVMPVDVAGGDYALGPVLLFGIIAFAVAYIIFRIRNSSDTGVRRKQMDYILSCCISACLFIVLSSSVFPWAYLEAQPVKGLITRILCMVQFPWRYLSIVTVLGVFAICGFWECFIKGSAITYKKNCVTVTTVVICVIASFPAFYFFAVTDSQAKEQRFYDSGGIMTYRGTGMGEYEPAGFEGVDVDRTAEELQGLMDPEYYAQREAGKALIISNYERSGTKASLVAENPSDSERTLYLPFIYYYGYRLDTVFSNGVEFTPEIVETEKGTVSVMIPAGFAGGLHLEYREPPAYRFAEACSLIFAIVLLLYMLRKKKKLSDK